MVAVIDPQVQQRFLEKKALIDNLYNLFNNFFLL